MKKTDIVEKIADKFDITKAEAERIVDFIFMDLLTNAMAKGEQVSIPGFGFFEGKMRAARTARNPQTGDKIDVPAMRVPKMRAAKALKDAVRG